MAANNRLMQTEAALAAEKVTIQKGEVAALRAVSFALKPGTLTGLIGPSGSGKTTLLRAIVGAQRITTGRLTVLGLPAGSKQLRDKLGYVTQLPAVYDDLTVRQNLNYFGAILGLGTHEVLKAMKAVDLMPQTSQLVGSLSGGQRARVSLAVALLDEPPLLVLDEPTVGLDPVLRQSLWQLFKQLAEQGRTLLISSHVMDEAEQCPQLLLLREGQVLSHGSRQELLRKTGTKTVQAAFLKLAGGEV